MVMFVYRTGAAPGNRHLSVAERAGVALEIGQSDLQGLFDPPAREHDIVPSGLAIPYAVLGMFFAFAGISILLLFQPQLLSEKWNVT